VVFKRATNIAKEAPTDIGAAPRDPGRDAPPAETALFASFQKLDGELASARDKRDWGKAFAAIAAFAPVLDQYFVDVMVMVDDADVRKNRLAMMRSISERCATVAHFQLLSSVASAVAAPTVDA
jgi:glycyl-tRNA synthetase beta chain